MEVILMNFDICDIFLVASVFLLLVLSFSDSYYYTTTLLHYNLKRNYKINTTSCLEYLTS